MRKLYAAFALAAALTASAAPLAAAEGAGIVEWVEVPAPSLAGNLLGTPDELPAAVYLPHSYGAEPDRRYPVVYLLHGIFDRPDVWLGYFELPQMLDRAMGSGHLPELIVVMPTGSNVAGGGFYRNSSVAGDWGDYVRHDLVSFVDGRFRTRPDRGSRALVGHSMGGFAAVWHAMTSADTFAVAYAMSPALLSVEDDVSHGNSAGWAGLLELGGLDGIEAALERREFWPVAAFSVCTSFLPDPDDPEMLCDPPYRSERGELIPNEAELDRWRRKLPLHAADEHLQALRSLAGLALDYGFDDQFAHIPETTQEMSAVLADLRVPHDLFVYRGDHRQQVKRRLEEVILPWVALHLEPETP